MGLIQVGDNESDMLSRVAESLYWMSRYLERAENTARLVDVHQQLMLDSAPEITEKQRVRRLLSSLDIRVKGDKLPEQDKILKTITFDSENNMSILSSITAARENARQVREQISSEMWMQLNKLYLEIREAKPERVWVEVPHKFYLSVKEGSHLFQGITDATMNHNQGWYFIQIGRYLERLMGLVTFLNVQFEQSEDFTSDNSRGNQYFELVALLKSISAFEAYCKVYNPDMKPDWIAEFLLFNAEFPRSARFCINTVSNCLESLSDVTMRHRSLRVNRLAGRLESTLSYDEIGEVLSGDFHDYLMNIKRQAFQIHDSLFDEYITYSIDAALK